MEFFTFGAMVTIIGLQGNYNYQLYSQYPVYAFGQEVHCANIRPVDNKNGFMIISISNSESDCNINAYRSDIKYPTNNFESK